MLATRHPPCALSANKSHEAFASMLATVKRMRDIGCFVEGPFHDAFMISGSPEQIKQAEAILTSDNHTEKVT